MASVEEPIIVRIVNDATATATSGGVGGAVGAVAGLTGLITIASEVAGLVKDAVKGVLKPAFSMVSGILKLLAQFLRPAIDILVIFLYPIMQILKPLVKMFNDVMRPFRQIAFRMMKEGGAAGIAAGAVIMQGFNTAIVNLLGGIIKQSMQLWVQIILNLVIKPITMLFDQIFGTNVTPKVESFFLDLVADAEKGIDTVLSGLNKASLNVAKTIAKTMGVTVDDIDFSTPMNKAKDKMQSSIFDFWNNLRFERSVGKSKVYTDSSGKMVVDVRESMPDFNARAAQTSQKYGIKSYDSPETILIRAGLIR
jgi:hypothetical protein